MSSLPLPRLGAFLALGLAVAACLPPARAAGWEPSRPVRLIVPAEAGGEADAMARAIQAIVASGRLMPQPIEVVNRPGEGGAEGFDEVQAARGDPHVLVMGLSNLFTAPPATGSIGWRDMAPVAMLALGPVALWVNAASPHRAVPDLVAAAVAGEARVGAAGEAGQAGEMVVSAVAWATGAGFTFAPLDGGAGGAARALAERRVDALVGSPVGAVADGWASGRLRPLCAFRRGARPGPAEEEGAANAGAWRGLPTCRDAGLGVEYSVFRGVLLPAAVTREQRAFYEALLRRVGDTPVWREVLGSGALESAVLGGDAFSLWLAAEELRHEEWMYAGEVFAGR